MKSLGKDLHQPTIPCGPAQPLCKEYLTGHPVWAELPEAQWGLYPSQQCDHIQVLDPAPVEGHTGWP